MHVYKSTLTSLTTHTPARLNTRMLKSHHTTKCIHAKILSFALPHAHTMSSYKARLLYIILCYNSKRQKWFVIRRFRMWRRKYLFICSNIYVFQTPFSRRLINVPFMSDFVETLWRFPTSPDEKWNSRKFMFCTKWYRFRRC